MSHIWQKVRKRKKEIQKQLNLRKVVILSIRKLHQESQQKKRLRMYLVGQKEKDHIKIKMEMILQKDYLMKDMEKVIIKRVLDLNIIKLESGEIEDLKNNNTWRFSYEGVFVRTYL